MRGAGELEKMKVVALDVYYGTNCYIVCDEIKKLCAIIDPGGDAEKVIAAVESSGCAPVAVLLTHGHYDHVGGVRGLRARWSELPVYLNRRDVYDTEDKKLLRLYPPIGDTLSCDEGDAVTVGDITVRVLATPGHTRGGVSLLAEDTLFCGDTLFASSMGRTDLFGGSDEEMDASLARLDALPGDYKLLPGHMGASTLERERQCNPYLIRARSHR